MEPTIKDRHSQHGPRCLLQNWFRASEKVKVIPEPVLKNGELQLGLGSALCNRLHIFHCLKRLPTVPSQAVSKREEM